MSEALALAKLGWGRTNPNPRHVGRGIEVLENAGIKCITGVCQDECIELNRPFFKYITAGKPFVILKMAMTLDGKIATADGTSKWITGVEARSRVQQLRRLADAIMIGGNTLRQDSPGLVVREPEDWPFQPRRLIVSSAMDEEEIRSYFPDGRAEKAAPGTPEEWNALMEKLGDEKCMVLLIEGGGEVADAALRAGVVDYVEFHIAPMLLGGRESIPVLGGDGLRCLDGALRLHRVKTAQYGSDIAISGYTEE